eukprot:5591033-Prymnesium_polylepis.1
MHWNQSEVILSSPTPRGPDPPTRYRSIYTAVLKNKPLTADARDLRRAQHIFQRLESRQSIRSTLLIHDRPASMRAVSRERHTVALASCDKRQCRELPECHRDAGGFTQSPGATA